MPAILEFFPEAALALSEEAKNHPLLLAELSRVEKANGQLDMELIVGVVAAYCNVALDGYYMEEDLIILFHLLLKRLKSMGEIVVH